MRQICDENDVLLIADEVMTGWFRTGPAFAMQNWDVPADIMTTAKGCTSAYTPVGITAASGKVADFFDEGFSVTDTPMPTMPCACRRFRRPSRSTRS